jgi:putative pyruvate formate lyase activating enzyme
MNITDKLERIQKALDTLSGHETDCRLCPRECGVNRKKEAKGFCQSGNQAFVSHTLLHYGEEPVLSGPTQGNTKKKEPSGQLSGSGTIFFSGCNLKCLYCQNYQLSWLNHGEQIADKELAMRILELQEKGALNINLVSPTHMLLPILRALKIAMTEGLHLPLVYNSNAYEKIEVIKCLEGIIDIYLPDLKYYSPQLANRFSETPDYFRHAHQAIQEMYCQQPTLHLSEENVAIQGLIIRHLVLPGQTADSRSILEWMAHNLSPYICLSLMSQYHPCHKAPREIMRSLSSEEYRSVRVKAKELGFENMFLQPESFSPEDHLIPDFDLESPFKWD